MHFIFKKVMSKTETYLAHLFEWLAITSDCAPDLARCFFFIVTIFRRMVLKILWLMGWEFKVWLIVRSVVWNINVIFPSIGNNNHPNWRTPIFQRGWNQPPTRLLSGIDDWLLVVFCSWRESIGLGKRWKTNEIMGEGVKFEKSRLTTGFEKWAPLFMENHPT